MAKLRILAAKAKVPAYLRVDMPQGWKDDLKAAMKKIFGPESIEVSEFDSSSTEWVVICHNTKDLTAQKLEDLLREELNCSGYMKVSPYEFLEGFLTEED